MGEKEKTIESSSHCSERNNVDISQLDSVKYLDLVEGMCMIIGMTTLNIGLIGTHLGMYLWIWKSLSYADDVGLSIRMMKWFVALMALNILVISIPNTLLHYLLSFEVIALERDLLTTVLMTAGLLGNIIKILGVLLLIYGIYKESIQRESIGDSNVD